MLREYEKISRRFGNRNVSIWKESFVISFDRHRIDTGKRKKKKEKKEKEEEDEFVNDTDRYNDYTGITKV